MKGKVFAKILESEFTRKIVKGTVRNAPKILTGISIASSIAAAGFAVKGTILAVEIEKRRKARIESGEIPEPEHPRLAVIKSVWKCYIPTFTFLTASIGAGLYGTNISMARTAMATAACKASELAFDEYKAKVIEELGEEKERGIRQSIVQDHLDQRANTQPSIITSYDKYLCREKISDKEIYSNLFEIRDAFLDMNYDMVYRGNDELSVKSYLEYFDIDSNNEDYGWNVSMTGKLDLSFSLEFDKYDRPILVFGPTQKPYDKYNIYG